MVGGARRRKLSSRSYVNKPLSRNPSRKNSSIEWLLIHQRLSCSGRKIIRSNFRMWKGPYSTMQTDVSKDPEGYGGSYILPLRSVVIRFDWKRPLAPPKWHNSDQVGSTCPRLVGPLVSCTPSQSVGDLAREINQEVELERLLQNNAFFGHAN